MRDLHGDGIYIRHIQWIDYSLLTNVQEMMSLRHGCTHIAECLESTTNELTRVTLKKIVVEQNDQLFDFHQVNCSNRIIDVCYYYIALN